MLFGNVGNHYRSNNTVGRINFVSLVDVEIFSLSPHHWIVGLARMLCFSFLQKNVASWHGSLI